MFAFRPICFAAASVVFFSCSSSTKDTGDTGSSMDTTGTGNSSTGSTPTTPGTGTTGSTTTGSTTTGSTTTTTSTTMTGTTTTGTPSTGTTTTTTTTGTTTPTTGTSTTTGTTPTEPVPMTIDLEWSTTANGYTTEIQAGDSVRWTTVGSHTVTSTDSIESNTMTYYPLDSGSLGTGDSYMYTFDEAGTYTYRCSPHASMTGTVVVHE